MYVCVVLYYYFVFPKKHLFKRLLHYCSEDIEQILQSLEKEAKTAVIVAIDSVVTGVIGISDQVKVSNNTIQYFLLPLPIPLFLFCYFISLKHLLLCLLFVIWE